ncbi:MAG: helix-turn-helix transcriptional regulator [Candidatus Levybacteria bacterium]|nr:helix-turn-helix transcriptional regulator [Candidatus Levybacteria bacterium]
MDDWEKHKKKLLTNPELKKLYAETRHEFEIARVVIRARIEQGLTQKQLAYKLKTRQSVVSRVENAKTVPSLSFLKRLAKALSLNLEIRFT